MHGDLRVLRGERDGLSITRSKAAALYERAKRHNDMEAAFTLVDAIYSEAAEERLIDKLITGGLAPIYVLPHPEFAEPDGDPGRAGHHGPTNAIPFAFSARLKEAVGGEVDDQIVQSARVGRTDMNRFQRFLWQPSFRGEVRVDRPYVLVDDVFTLGGTFGALQSHIQSHGGTIVAVTTLARKGGASSPLALTGDTLRALHGAYGVDFGRFWKEVIGHEAECLSDAEGAFLVEWTEQHHAGRSRDERLHALRDRLLEVRDRGE